MLLLSGNYILNIKKYLCNKNTKLNKIFNAQTKYRFDFQYFKLFDTKTSKFKYSKCLFNVNSV